MMHQEPGKIIHNMSNVRCFDISIVPQCSVDGPGRGKQSPAHWLTMEKNFRHPTVLAEGSRTNHFCSVSCEIKRLLIVFINQFDHQR